MLGLCDLLTRCGSSTLGLDDKTLDQRAALFERLCDSRISSARTDEVHECIDSSVAGVPNFRSGLMVMRKPVSIPIELIRAERVTFCRYLLGSLINERQIAARHLTRH